MDFIEPLTKEISNLILSEREHIGETSKEVHTMNLLFGSFFGKDRLTKAHKEIMKALQGVEVHTLIIDKVIDKPQEIEDKGLKTIIGFIIYSAMTEKFLEALKELGLSYENRILAMDKWNETLKHLYFGEGLDVIYTNKKIRPFSLEEYTFMIKETTAKFIQLSLFLGALISGLNERDIERILEYGINVGIAFQIRDDYYDMENDILEKKQRAFLIKDSLDLLDNFKRDSIIRDFPDNPNEIIPLIKNSKIPEFVKNLNHSFLDNALKNIENLNGDYVIRLKEIAKLLRI